MISYLYDIWNTVFSTLQAFWSFPGAVRDAGATALRAAVSAADFQYPIQAGPQVPLQSVYQDILAFFLTLDPTLFFRKLEPLIHVWDYIGTFLSLLFLVALIMVVRKLDEFHEKQTQKEAADLAAAGAPPSAVAAVLRGTAGPGFFSILAYMRPTSGDSVIPAVPAVTATVLTAEQAGIAGSAPANLPGANEIAAPKQAEHRKKWQRVVDHVNSNNPNDWRLSILEADVLLEDHLELMGAHGDTLGDKLKSMSSAEMPSLQMAWEGHLIRNRIAHEGADFVLSQREARRIIQLYETVFRQGLYI